MNKIEKIVYDALKNNPKLKTVTRNIYQSIFDLIPDKKNYFDSDIIVREGYFFGFHDVSPFSKDETHILANKLLIGLHMPAPEEKLGVGFWDENLDKFYLIKETCAWNYHKGCRLQWVGDSCDSFIFNDIVEGHLGANIYSIKNQQFKSIYAPIDTVSPDGKYATTFSYERLDKYMPGYGYPYSDSSFLSEPASENTGLSIIDLDSGNTRMIISLRQLSQIKPESTMRGANHYVTHTQFSPDGRKVAFLHRWTFDDPDKRWTRLVTCDIDGTNIYISNTSGMVSHFDWDKEHGILAYCQVDGIDGHFIFSDYKMESAKRVGGKINSDGHQSYIPNTNYFVTDTYPDRRRYAKIYKINIENDAVKLIADIKSPKKYQSPDLYRHWACDLHPRVSPSGKWLCFDSVHTGKRALCIIKNKR